MTKLEKQRAEAEADAVAARRREAEAAEAAAEGARKRAAAERVRAPSTLTTRTAHYGSPTVGGAGCKADQGGRLSQPAPLTMVKSLRADIHLSVLAHS